MDELQQGRDVGRPSRPGRREFRNHPPIVTGRANFLAANRETARASTFAGQDHGREIRVTAGRRIKRLLAIGLVSSATLTPTGGARPSGGAAKGGSPSPTANQEHASVATVRPPQDCSTVLSGGSAEAIAAEGSAQLFASAPIVVLAGG